MLQHSATMLAAVLYLQVDHGAAAAVPFPGVQEWALAQPHTYL
jgi:hypothetical protein